MMATAKPKEKKDFERTSAAAADSVVFLYGPAYNSKVALMLVSPYSGPG